MRVKKNCFILSVVRHALRGRVASKVTLPTAQSPISQVLRFAETGFYSQVPHEIMTKYSQTVIFLT